MFGIKSGFDIVIANPPYVRQEAIKKIKPQLKKDFGDFYCGTADLYTYFFKLGLEILNNGGHLCFISPNKFMKTGYGKNTRRLLSQSATPKLVIDFGELPVFEAGTDPSIILVENRKPAVDADGEFTTAVIKTKEEIGQLVNILGQRGLKMKVLALHPDAWTLEKRDVLSLLEKLRKCGEPLGKYIQDKFFYGIKTGFNEAYVINGGTREKLITEAPRSAELIKPWLRGRDIRKWRSEWAGFYVIAIPSSANREWPWSNENNEETARKSFQKSYPAVYRHLSQWEKELRKREDQGKFWWELRSCGYYDEFEKPKIIYPIVAKEMRASFYNECYFLNDKNFMIPIEDYLLMALLNSKIMDFYFRQTFAGHGDPFNKGRIEFRKIFMELMPVAPADKFRKSSIEDRVHQILADPTGQDVARLEAEIDQMVYGLYALTEEEIAMVEKESGGKEQ